MHFLILDTNIYISFFLEREKSVPHKSYDAILGLLNNNKVKIILPSLVQVEFKQNAENGFILSKETLKNWINTIEKGIIQIPFGTQYQHLKQLRKTLLNLVKNLQKELQQFDFKEFINGADSLFNHSNTIKVEYDSGILFKAYKRTLEKKPPSHNNDQLKDCIILESMMKYFDEHPLNRKQKATFVSYNSADFAEKKGSEILHPELEPLFKSYRIGFQTVLAKFLKKEFSISDIGDDDLKDEETLIERFSTELPQTGVFHTYPWEKPYAHSIFGSLLQLSPDEFFSLLSVPSGNIIPPTADDRG
jgi:predicted nucleic-acid-binding protein